MTATTQNLVLNTANDGCRCTPAIQVKISQPHFLLMAAFFTFQGARSRTASIFSTVTNGSHCKALHSDPEPWAFQGVLEQTWREKTGDKIQER
jgi:hypothetical protein